MNSLKLLNRWKIKHWLTSLKILWKAEELAEDLASNQPQGDEEIAGELNDLAGETTDLIEETHHSRSFKIKRRNLVSKRVKRRRSCNLPKIWL